MSFGWLFAFIAGAVILFLAIYFASQLITTGQYELDAKTAKQLGVIFDPMETGIASAKSTKATINKETRFYFDCRDSGEFGELRISTSSKTFGGWSEKSIPERIKNKYVFSQEEIEGKEFYFTSLPFEFPFKVSEIILMYNQRYCFLDRDIKITGEGIETNCSADSVKVCFEGGNFDEEDCDVVVFGLCEDYTCEDEFDYGYIIKRENGREIRLDYEGNLLYGAIFSSPELYNCEIRRLMMRLKHISALYREETLLLDSRGINTGLGDDLLILSSLTEDIENSGDLAVLREYVKEIEEANNNLGDRKIW